MKNNLYEIANHLDKNSQSERGSFYTPEKLAIKMAKLLKLKSGQKILDPCCGKGNLFQAVLDTYSFINESDLYGIDIDEEAIKFCIKKWPNGNFQIGDSLKDPIFEDEFWEKNSLETWEEYCERKPSFKRNFGKVI